MTKTCYYNVTTIIRQALDYAKEQDLIPFNPMREIKVSAKLFRKVKKKPNETQVFTVEERKEINRYAWDDFRNEVKDYVLSPLAMLFQFETGVRIGELCALRYEDIENDHMLHVQRMYRRDVRDVVEQPHCINELYKKYSKYLGGPHRSSHKSRKTWISSLIDCQDMNINTIREMAGHEDERTTFKNYCFDRGSNP